MRLERPSEPCRTTPTCSATKANEEEWYGTPPKLRRALLGLVAATPSAQSTVAQAALQAALKTTSGGIDVRTLQVSAAGWSSDIGQTYGLDEDWAKFEVANYVRLLDYSANTPREDCDRKQGMYPLNGRTPRPDTHVTQILFNGQAPTTAIAAMRTLKQNITKWKLDVAQHVPAHGRVAIHDEFLKAFGTTAASK